MAVTTLFYKTSMRHYYRFCILFLLVVPFVFLSGCSRGPKVNYVEGIVTLDGTPVEGVDVAFVPVQIPAPNDLTGSLLATGYTDSNGKYQLSTTRGSAVDGGTTVGEYKVTFVKKFITFGAGGPTGNSPPQMRYDVPAVFENSDNSKILVEVVRGKNIFNFALKSDGTCEMTK